MEIRGVLFGTFEQRRGGGSEIKLKSALNISNGTALWFEGCFLAL